MKIFPPPNERQIPVLIVIPAVDIKDGRCVRLRQGNMSEETVFSDSPLQMAVTWWKKGAERLHLVDLDGAFRGRPVNGDVIRGIVEAVPIPVQLGGGIRDMATVEAYFETGLQYLILGTVAHKDPDLVFSAAKRFPGRIILGIDTRKGMVALEGWTEQVGTSAVSMAKKFEDSGISAIIHTDINRDGMRSGPNMESTGDLARSTSVPVIASGGISGLENIRDLMPLERDGVIGAVTGRALYDGSLDLTEAIALAKSEIN